MTVTPYQRVVSQQQSPPAPPPLNMTARVQGDPADQLCVIVRVCCSCAAIKDPGMAISDSHRAGPLVMRSRQQEGRMSY